MSIRYKIYQVIEPASKSTAWSLVYDVWMMILILCSIIPLAFRTEQVVFDVLDKISVSFFILDYLLRWLTADFKLPGQKGWRAFVVYPFTGFAIVDLLSILPSFNIGSKVLKVFRVPRLLKILRIFKFIRYSENIQLLLKVLRKEKSILLTVMYIAIAYIFITALIMFNVEDTELFQNYFDALYWATTTLTTVGYGDVIPQTDMGRVISMLSALMGVAVIALPSGVITASYLDELRDRKKTQLAQGRPLSRAERLPEGDEAQKR